LEAFLHYELSHTPRMPIERSAGKAFNRPVISTAPRPARD
jgi:hypothetical protein